MALVIGDDPRRPFQTSELTADWTFLRFHHGRRGRRGNYSESELRDWAGRIAGLRERAEVFAYFNNDWEAFAVRNARRLLKLTAARDAGWSSQVARRAHNPKVAGSNPAPAIRRRRR